MKTQSNYSIFQIVCGILVFAAYFLPWLSISVLGQNVFSASFIDGIIQFDKISGSVSDVGSALSTNIKNYVFVLYVIPALSLVNAIMQWMGKHPILTFYSTVFPVGIAFYGIILCLMDDSSMMFDAIGIGLYVSLIVGTISMIAAWTYMGCNYDKYRGYIKFVTICFAASIIWWIIVCSFAALNVADSFHLGMDVTRLIMCVCFIIGLFMSISTLHLPFVVYVWIVTAISKANTVRPITVEAEADALEQQVVQQKEVDIKEDMKEFCPQCHIRISASVNFCPNCGFNLKKVAEES